jgi:hypothetical protein
VTYLLLNRTVGRPLRYVGFEPGTPAAAVCSILASLTVIPLAVSVEAVVMSRFEIPEEWVEYLYRLVRAETVPELIAAWLVASPLGAVSEEFLFRGVFQNSLSSRLKGWLAILIASAVFGLLHTWRFPAAFVLGVFMGFLYLRTRSLVIPIAAHMTINSVAVLGVFAVERMDQSRIPAWIVENQPAPLPILLVSALLFSLVMLVFWRETSGLSKPR